MAFDLLEEVAGEAIKEIGSIFEKRKDPFAEQIFGEIEETQRRNDVDYSVYRDKYIG